MAPRLTFGFMQAYCDKLRAGEKLSRLSRTVVTQDQYDAHKRQYPDRDKFILMRYLMHCDSSLVRNKFPFPLESNVTQYVLWCKTPRTIADVDRLVRVAFAPKRIALYENQKDWHSSSNLAHFHIFVEDYEQQ